MSGLETLIKLQKTKVDEQRIILAKIQSHLDWLETEIAQLELQRVQEHLAVQEHPEMSQTYGDYIKRLIEKSRDLEKKKQAALIAVEIARDRLAVLFEEQKRYEIALANRIAAQIKEDNRRETIDLDEVGSVSFMRHKVAG